MQALDDMIRITANGLTFGGADRLAGTLDGTGYAAEQAKTAAARDRAGFAGDVAAFVGPAKGLQLGWQGLKAGAKAAPAIGRAIFSKGGALAAGALGAGAYNYGQRTGGSQAQAAPAPKPRAAAPAAAAAPSMPRDKMAGDIMTGLDRLGPTPPTFESMVQQVAQGQGGNINMRQLLGLAETAQRIAPRGSGRPPRPGEEAGRMLEQGYIQQLQSGQIDPDEFEKRVLQLNKAQLIDPYGLYGDDQGN